MCVITIASDGVGVGGGGGDGGNVSFATTLVDFAFFAFLVVLSSVADARFACSFAFCIIRSLSSSGVLLVTGVVALSDIVSFVSRPLQKKKTRGVTRAYLAKQ